MFLIPHFGRGLKGLRYLLALAVLPILILRENVQIVQFNGFLEAAFLIPSRLLGREAIYTQHGLFEHQLYRWYENPRRYFPRLLARVCIHFASHVVCVSEGTGRVIRGVVPPERTSVIPNWVSSIPPYQRVSGSSGADLHLLYVGRLEKYKGLHLLLTAMRSLPGARLTVVGDGSYRRELEHLSAGLNVRFEGFQSDPGRYYTEADIFVMPSLGPEGLPMVSIEAMAHGLPCLFSDIDVHREITASGTAGMLFTSGDAESLRGSLSTLMKEAGLRSAYSQAAYHRVKEAYNPEIAFKAYVWALGL